MTDTIVAVLVEHRNHEIAQPTFEALTLARSIGRPVAVWMGQEPPADAVAALGEFGAQEVRVLAIGERARHPKTASAALAAAAGDAALVLVVSTFLTKEIATHLAIATDAGVVVDAAGADMVDGRVEVRQTVFGATWNVRTRINADRAIVAVLPNTTKATPADTAAVAEVVDVVAALPDVRESIDAVVPVAREEGVPLSEAAVVVAGGRGTNGDYTLVRELADVLSGAVGASRDATDEGWISHEHMVGQTGVTVTPALYVACGISGAVHHRGGMQASGTIVAVNIDPDAPIFEIADFGVVGDLNDVLPQAIDALRAHRQG